MPRFYEKFSEPEVGSWMTLSEESFHHAMRVLRLKQEDSVELFNGFGVSVKGQILFTKQEARVHVQSVSQQEKTIEIILIQALLNNEKLDWVIEKSCELGVTGISIYSPVRGEIRLSEEKLDKRLERWNKIAIASCKQCGQNRLPTINYFSCLNDALREKKQRNYVLVPASEELQLDSRKTDSVSFIVGPEGGLSKEEIEAAKSSGWSPLKLGNLILRTETAGLAAVSFAQTLWGNWH